MLSGTLLEASSWSPGTGLHGHTEIEVMMTHAKREQTTGIQQDALYVVKRMVPLVWGTAAFSVGCQVQHVTLMGYSSAHCGLVTGKISP